MSPTSLHNLAELYGAQGHYGEAEPLHRRALAIREQVLGPDQRSQQRSLPLQSAMVSQGLPPLPLLHAPDTQVKPARHCPSTD